MDADFGLLPAVTLVTSQCPFGIDPWGSSGPSPSRRLSEPLCERRICFTQTHKAGFGTVLAPGPHELALTPPTRTRTLLVSPLPYVSSSMSAVYTVNTQFSAPFRIQQSVKAV